MNKIFLAIVLIGLGACAETSKKSQAENGGNAAQEAPCTIRLERKCIVPGEKKCLAYETEDRSNCKEGN